MTKYYSFLEEAVAEFESAALERYDFTTCQRSDGSYYGTGGQCRKGTEATLPKKESKGKKEGGRPPGEAAAQAENDARMKRAEEDGRRGVVKVMKENAEAADRIRASKGSSDMTVTSDENGVYIEQKVGNRSIKTTLEKGRGGEIQIAYEVDGSYDAGKVTDRGEQIKVARTAHRQFQEAVKSMEDGTEVAVYAHKDDGNGAAREKAYKKLGFGDPDRDGLMMGQVFDGEVGEVSYYSESKGKISEKESIKIWTSVIFGK